MPWCHQTCQWDIPEKIPWRSRSLGKESSNSTVFTYVPARFDDTLAGIPSFSHLDGDPPVNLQNNGSHGPCLDDLPICIHRFSYIIQISTSMYGYLPSRPANFPRLCCIVETTRHAKGNCTQRQPELRCLCVPGLSILLE